MTAPLTASDVAADIQREDGPDAEALIAAFRSSPLEAKGILSDLAVHRDPIVRAWAAWAAARSLPRGKAVAIALQLAKDKDSDVRDVAVEELVDLDHSTAIKLAPALRRKLQSKSFYEPITAMWALAAIGDASAADAILEAGARWDNALHRNTATVASALLRGEGDDLVRKVRFHDHELMPWLSKALRLLGTEEARQALEGCSNSAPDIECRNYCRE